jgi:AI-2 transport protein TqsA
MASLSSKSNIFVVIGSIFIILAGLKIASSIVIPILLATFLTIIILPLYRFLNKRLPMWVTYITIVLVMVLTIYTISKIATVSVNSFSQNLPAYQVQLSQKMAPIEEQLAQYGIEFDSNHAFDSINPQSLLKYSMSILTSMSGVLGNITIILILVIFMMLEIKLFSRKFDSIVTDPDSHERMDHIFENISKYFTLKVAFSLLTGLLIYIGLSFLGVDNALLWALVAFGLNFIPTVGSIAASIPAILVTFVQFDLTTVAIVILLYMSVNIIVGSIIEPRAMGSGLGISPLVVFISLLFWGYIFGVIGMLLAVPLTMVIKIVMDANESTHKIAVMLGD